MGADPPEVLSGPRLDLVLVTVEQLLSRDGVAAPVPLGFEDPDDVLAAPDSPLRYRIPQVRTDPSVNPWLLRLAVLRAESTIIGLTNFHDRPDASGMVEIGYSVLPDHRREGYACEMAMTMWRFASTHSQVRVLRATVGPDNLPSLRIIEAAGFRLVGEQDDPEDGLELVYELEAAEFARMHE